MRVKERMEGEEEEEGKMRGGKMKRVRMEVIWEERGDTRRKKRRGGEES